MSDSVDHFPYLFACYTVVWVGVAAYVLRLGRRHRALEREIEDLRQLLTREPRK